MGELIDPILLPIDEARESLGTNSESFRHYCEVLGWIRRTGGDIYRLKMAMNGVRAKRGKQATNKLRADIWKRIKHTQAKAS